MAKESTRRRRAGISGAAAMCKYQRFANIGKLVKKARVALMNGIRGRPVIVHQQRSTRLVNPLCQTGEYTSLSIAAYAKLAGNLGNSWKEPYAQSVCQSQTTFMKVYSFGNSKTNIWPSSKFGCYLKLVGVVKDFRTFSITTEKGSKNKERNFQI